jgi:hypothetical protein
MEEVELKEWLDALEDLTKRRKAIYDQMAKDRRGRKR